MQWRHVLNRRIVPNRSAPWNHARNRRVVLNRSARCRPARSHNYGLNHSARRNRGRSLSELWRRRHRPALSYNIQWNSGLRHTFPRSNTRLPRIPFHRLVRSHNMHLHRPQGLLRLSPRNGKSSHGR